MKKLLSIAAFTFLSLISYSQNVKQDAAGNYTAISASKKVDRSKSTGKTYTDAKGKVYSVLVTAAGKLFVLRTSAKTGNVYKQYLKL